MTHASSANPPRIGRPVMHRAAGDLYRWQLQVTGVRLPRGKRTRLPVRYLVRPSYRHFRPIGAFAPSCANPAARAASSFVAVSGSKLSASNRPPDPGSELFMLLVIAVGKRLQKLFVTRVSAYVFGRAGSCTFHADGVSLTRFNPQAAFGRESRASSNLRSRIHTRKETARRSWAGSCSASSPGNP